MEAHVTYVIVRLEILDGTHCGNCEFIDRSDDDPWCMLFNEFLQQEKSESEEKPCLRCTQCIDNETATE
jgi:hypothetical protein